jgi:hypothetical protein
MASHDYVIDQAVVDLLAARLMDKFAYLLNPESAWYVAEVAARELVRIQRETGKDLIVRSDLE